MASVDKLVEQVRQQIDEDSDSDITNTRIIDALQRGYDEAFDLVARYYPDTIITTTNLFVDSETKVTIPAGIFEDRILHIDVLVGPNPYPLDRLPYYNIGRESYTGSTNFPQYYAILGRTLIFPNAANGTEVVLYHTNKMPPLTHQLGRITRVVDEATTDHVVVDSLGPALDGLSDLSTDSDSLNSYINIVNFVTGEVKGTFQVKSTVGDRVNFKATPSRSTVLNQTISSDFSTLTESPAVDDFICLAEGTCVPYFQKPTTNFIIQYAVTEIRRSLSLDIQAELIHLSKLEDKVKSIWVGRESALRVAQKSKNWRGNRHRRRIFF